MPELLRIFLRTVEGRFDTIRGGFSEMNRFLKDKDISKPFTIVI